MPLAFTSTNICSQLQQQQHCFSRLLHLYNHWLTLICISHILILIHFHAHVVYTFSRIVRLVSMCFVTLRTYIRELQYTCIVGHTQSDRYGTQIMYTLTQTYKRNETNVQHTGGATCGVIKKACNKRECDSRCKLLWLERCLGQPFVRRRLTSSLWLWLY